MTDASGPDRVMPNSVFMDELLRTGLPEIKLALGTVIDRENARPLPPRYARLLPPTRLIVVLRADAAEALEPIATDVERELTDSCNRHGSLYDRSYRVELQRSGDPDAPLYSVSARAGEDAENEPPAAGEPPPIEPASAPRAGSIRLAEPDAMPVGDEAPVGWTPHAWVLIVESDGEEKEAFRLGEPVVTVGRSANDPHLSPSIAISNAPHVSRRQLVLQWQERDGAPGFRVYNIGLNSIHLPGREIAGANRKEPAIDLDAIPPESAGWIPPGVPVRIGDHGPNLRIDEVPPGPDEDPAVDPDATVFGD